MNTKDIGAACRHHWIIEPANGPLSAGKCKRCGLERDFINNPDEARIDRAANPVSSNPAVPAA